MRLVYLAVVAASMLGLPVAIRAGELPTQTPSTTPAVQKVRIVVATAAAHGEQCKAGKYQPVDILVDANPRNNAPSHCVMGAVLEHGKAHANKATIVVLSAKEKNSVLWYSDSEFQITAIEPHPEYAATAPKNPFLKPILNIPSKSLESGPIREAAANHGYKITLMVNGRPIDPDLWCNP